MSWTDTQYYLVPSQAEAEALPCVDHAVDHVGLIEGVEGWHVNARWWLQEPGKWAPYRITPPENPVRVFA